MSCTSGRLTEGTVTAGTVIAGNAGAASVGAGVVTVGAIASAAGGLGFDVGACDVCSEASAAAETVGVAVTLSAT